jgi:hypothetical protein
VPPRLSKHIVGVLAVLLCACDEPSSPPIADPVQPINTTTDVADPTPSATSTTEPEPEPPPTPAGGPHCDQVAGDKTERVCIDYGEHTGPVAPRCFAGVSLAEGPCPSEGRIGECKLPATGVTLVYYEGQTVEAATQVCDTIDGVFEAS